VPSPLPDATVTATCFEVSVASTGGLTSVLLVFADGTTVSYSGGGLHQLFDVVDQRQGSVFGGAFDVATFPGLTRVDVVAPQSVATASIPSTCEGLAPLPPAPPVAPPAVPPSETPTPVPGPGPEGPEASPPPREIGGPLPEPVPTELPATGADVPSQLGLAFVALLCGFGLLRGTRPPAPVDPLTVNGFRRIPRASTGQ
jgi:hypothetical protein